MEDLIVNEFDQRVFKNEKLPSVLLKAKKLKTTEFIKSQLSKVNVSKLNYLQRKILVNKLVEDWYNSRVQVGKAVGVVAAQSIGERATQQSMKTLHTAGISLGKSSLGGIARVEEILDVKKNPSKPSMKFFIKNSQISPIEAKVITGAFQYLTFADLILRRETTMYQHSIQESNLELQKLKKENTNPKRIKELKNELSGYKESDFIPSWFRTFDKIFNINKPLDENVSIWFKLKLDVKKCYMKRIDYLTIVRRIQQTLIENKIIISEAKSDVRFYFSDFYTGEFHILFDEDTAIKIGQQYNVNIKHELFQRFSFAHIQGVKEITNVFAQNYLIRNFITDIVEHDTHFQVLYNEKELKRTLVGKDIVKNFIELKTGIRVDIQNKMKKTLTKKQILEELDRDNDILEKVCSITSDKDFIYIDYPKSNSGVTNSDFVSVISQFDSDFTKNGEKGFKIKNNIELELVKKTFVTNRKRLDSNKYWYWETDGSNLKGLLNFEGHFRRDNGNTEKIDIIFEKLTSNHIPNINMTFGIEAAKRLIIDEMMASTSDVHIAHIQELADMMCSQGFMVQVGRHGLLKSGAGHLTTSSFEENTKHMIISGSYGAKDEANSIDAANITGVLANIGANVEKEEQMKENQKAKSLMRMFRKPTMSGIVSTPKQEEKRIEPEFKKPEPVAIQQQPEPQPLPVQDETEEVVTF